MVIYFLLTIFLSYVIMKDIGYRDGQIDAALGKQNYELIQHEDSTKTWERIRKE